MIGDASQTAAGRGLRAAILTKVGSFASSAPGVADADGAIGADEELTEFLASNSTRQALRHWFGDQLDAIADRGLRLAIDRDIAELDAKISEQVDAIRAHAAFNSLEASWRGLEWLVRERMGTFGDGQYIIRVLNVSWAEITRDVMRAPSFDQTNLYALIHDGEFAIAGGQPFGLMATTYTVVHHRTGAKGDDIGVLRELAKIASAAFCPFVFDVGPEMLGVDHIGDLSRREDLSSTFALPQYRRFKDLAARPEARFLVLTVGRLLVRDRPIMKRAPRSGFIYSGGDMNSSHQSCFTPASFAVGKLVIRAHANYSWPAAIRGAPQREHGEVPMGGVLSPPQKPVFTTDTEGVWPKIPLEVVLPQRLENQLNDLGFAALVPCAYTEDIAFFDIPSMKAPERGAKKPISLRQGKMDVLLNYVLCVSRFAHYVKVLAREWIGSYQTASQCEKKLQQWLAKYCIDSDDVDYEERARFPLRHADITVKDVASRQGAFACTMRLQPHFQLEQIASEFELATDIQATGGKK